MTDDKSGRKFLLDFLLNPSIENEPKLDLIEKFADYSHCFEIVQDFEDQSEDLKSRVTITTKDLLIAALKSGSEASYTTSSQENIVNLVNSFWKEIENNQDKAEIEDHIKHIYAGENKIQTFDASWDKDFYLFLIRNNLIELNRNIILTLARQDNSLIKKERGYSFHDEELISLDFFYYTFKAIKSQTYDAIRHDLPAYASCLETDDDYAFCTLFISYSGQKTQVLANLYEDLAQTEDANVTVDHLLDHKTYDYRISFKLLLDELIKREQNSKENLAKNRTTFLNALFKHQMLSRSFEGIEEYCTLIDSKDLDYIKESDLATSLVDTAVKNKIKITQDDYNKIAPYLISFQKINKASKQTLEKLDKYASKKKLQAWLPN
ncbi:hypothetical protein OZX67_08950 [Bifidobacterium sp. ESL0728]|uniref:hypothetical protein n=1 Tax=Bifidobacterium sp. ESL0728 TaxID=2983220 RepID=UPI0023F75DB1|nr:hypothetical protein [Bifidobacterium sp. ESL0728]WEV58897.1 hypothetical protein OZX67_08950 [Bifidobacterium sp. ESL0728]